MLNLIHSSLSYIFYHIESVTFAVIKCALNEKAYFTSFDKYLSSLEKYSLLITIRFPPTNITFHRVAIHIDVSEIPSL